MGLPDAVGGLQTIAVADRLRSSETLPAVAQLFSEYLFLPTPMTDWIMQLLPARVLRRLLMWPLILTLLTALVRADEPIVLPVIQDNNIQQIQGVQQIEWGTPGIRTTTICCDNPDFIATFC